MANKAKLDIQSNNKILLPPNQTKTFSKSQNQDELRGDKFDGKTPIKKELNSRDLHSPPPSLDDIMVKVRMKNVGVLSKS